MQPSAWVRATRFFFGSGGSTSGVAGTLSRPWVRAIGFAALGVLAIGWTAPALAQTGYVFDLVRGEFTVIGPFGGVNVVEASGPATVEVTFETALGAAQDDDAPPDLLEEVQIELVALALTGDSDFGVVPVGLWSGAQSLGEIEEQVDNTTGVLDLPPFAAGGAADSFFDLHIETTVFGITVHNVVPARIATVITEWPPPAGEIYVGVFDPPIPLLNDLLGELGVLTRAELELQPRVGDYGDAPDPLNATAGEYPTLAASNGAAHSGDGTLRLGTLWDREFDAVPNATATGDGADEDGVVFTTPLQLNVLPTQTTVDVTASQAGLLDAWVDFNIDGDWSDAGEQVFSGAALAAGLNQLSFSVPVNAVLGCSYARFRLSTAGGLSPTGVAADGEVEDYQIGIVPVADLDLFNKSLAGVQSFFAGNSITAGGDFTSTPDLIVLDGAQVVFHAGSFVAIKNGLAVEQNGDLTVTLGSVPGGCPP